MWEPISALAAAAGVTVATVLGLMAVNIARKTVVRSELEYRSGRADRVLEKAAQIESLLGEYRAALQVYWKEQYGDVRTWWADPGMGEDDNAALVSARFAWLLNERGSGERRAHEIDYKLAGAAGEFRALVRATGADEAESSRLFALLDVLRGSVRAQYHSLIPEVPWGVDPSSDAYGKKVLTAMANTVVEPLAEGEAQDELKRSVVTWFSNYLKDNDDAAITPAVAAIDFYEDFVQAKWMPDCERLVGPAHARALVTP
ncbi:hypothetical protein GCM10027020_36790 [Nocardioides salsibiostraticola]